MFSLSLFAALAFIAVTVSSQTTSISNATVGARVNTTSGQIIGHPNQQYPYVGEYLGIPFAKAPINSLRFLPPQKCTNSGQVLHADTQAPSCPQQRNVANYTQPPNFTNYTLFEGTYANYTNEDCLYLNVWSKAPFQGAPLKPVLIWLYGGGFHAGGIRDGAEQGAIFAEQQDVIVVSVNYRLGLLGFPGAPNMQQNLGLLDQRLAVEWVRDNIKAFGGDATRISLFGHSAGGASVDYYNYAYLRDPIISGSIIMSGSALSFGNRSPKTAANAWYTAASLLGCGNSTTNATKVLACMQQKNATEILKVTPTVEASLIKSLPSSAAAYIGITGPFGPTIDNVTVFENYTIRGKQGQFIQRPVLVGSADNEGCLFAENGVIPISDEDTVTEVVFTCPNYHTTKARLDAKLPTWQYRYFGAYNNTYANACPGQPWHGQEVYVMYGSTHKASGFKATKKENEMGWYLRQTWATFAHDPQNGLRARSGWPESNSNESEVMALGLNSTLNVIENAAAWNKPCVNVLVSGAPNI